MQEQGVQMSNRYQSMRAMVAAGGTGGHVFPALAVAQELSRRGAQIRWIGSSSGMESRVVSAAGIGFCGLKIRGLRRAGLTRWVQAPVQLFAALWMAVREMRRFRPQVVLAMGGYVSGPSGLAAWLLRVPLVVHEQNSIPGPTNRLLRPLARRVLTGFPVPDWMPAAQAVGNPVRAPIAELAAAEPVETTDAADRPVRLLVLGGSQGAQALNELVPGALALLSSIRLEVWHQCGAGKDVDTTRLYRAAQLDARVEPFIEDMARAYRWADVAVCRAGALTVSELCCAGVPAVLVPFPHAVDDHQFANAQWLERAGGAKVMREHDLNPSKLAALVSELATDQAARTRMAACAHEQARPDAAVQVADCCAAVARAA